MHGLLLLLKQNEKNATVIHISGIEVDGGRRID